MIGKTGKFTCLCALAVFGAWSGAARADVIYDNGGPDELFAVFSSIAAGAPILVFDDFTLQEGNETISDVHWWGAYLDEDYDPTAEDQAFGILIVADDGGAPDLTGLGFEDIEFVFPTVTATGEEVDTVALPFGFEDGPRDLFEYSAFLDTPVTLTAGTPYWISIFDMSVFVYERDPSSDPAFCWSTTDEGNAVLFAFETLEIGADMAFHLTDDAIVPEPATISLLALGIVGVAARARRARR
jgi:hypothetical protein